VKQYVQATGALLYPVNYTGNVSVIHPQNDVPKLIVVDVL